MKTFYTVVLLPLMFGVLDAQMEPGNYAITPDLSGNHGNNNANNKKPRSSHSKKARDSRADDEEYDDEDEDGGRTSRRRGAGGGSGTTDNGEPENPRLMGMEIPLLDPSSDTVTYNGGKFDVGNNALVRARFEKYLQQNPDDSAEAKRYRQRMDDLLKLTQNNARQHSEVGSQTLLQIGRGLYEINTYPGDAGQSATLASAIASALSVQYANRAREQKNEQLTHEIERLVHDTDILTTRNTHGPSHKQVGNGRGARVVKNDSKSHTFRIAEQTTEIATKKGTKVKNDADSVAALELSKINYQATLVSFLFQRRFEHALIGSFAYRHIFRDGDNKLNIKKDSQAAKVFENGAGLPPTINSIASLAANARREVDQNMEAVTNLLAQNKLAEATQHLIEAVAIGEYMPSVATFPTESRRRIAEFWTLRKRTLTALNARDYGTLEEIADKMKALDADFDDSLVRTYCDGRKLQSDMCLRNARKAFLSGDEEAATDYAEQAALIWPRNPHLKEMQEEVLKLDNNEAIISEFKSLYARHQYRTIYNERSKFKVVAIDQELEAQLEDCATLVGTIDAMLSQIDKVVHQDKKMGPCMAYEMLLDFQDTDPRYMEDSVFKDAVVRFKVDARDFVAALDEAKVQEERREYGSALANYYRAQCLCATSKRAEEGIDRISQLILSSRFPQ
ncbi:MAG: hypothetical protein Q4E43_02275 [Akkermansia sp.]|nr:hypothetical protein [Akkermansia sp.]